MVGDILKLIYENARGERIEFYRSPYFLENVSGLSETEAENQSQKSPYQDGETYIDTLLQPRFIELEGAITSPNFNQARQELIRVCNPKLGLGKLIYEMDGEQKEIECVLEGVPVFPKKRVYQQFIIHWRCPYPYWREINPINIKLADFVPNFSYPFSFPVTFSLRGDAATITNSGHVPTPVTVTFRGEAINPKITKEETGEFIKVNRTIPIGYSLIINTEFNNKSVRIVSPDGTETNAMGYIDLDSTFFLLEVGNNPLSFITDGGNPEVYVEFNNLYVGV